MYLSRSLSLSLGVFAFNLLISTTSGAYISDNGCPCSNNANLTINGGCRLRTVGFDGVTPSVTWCLTDQVKSPGCGTLSGYGYADTCANAGFTSVTVLPNQVLLVPGQDQWTFYTGQSINLTWSSTLFENNERVVFSVYTPNNPSLRNILGTGGGGGGGGITSVSENITLGSLRAGLAISTSTFTPVFTTVGNVGAPSPVQFSTVVSGTNNNANSDARVMNSTQLITILQHRIINVEAYVNSALLTPSTNLPLDDRIITVRWSAQGFARRGTATVTFQRCGGGGCSQGNPTTNTQFDNNIILTLDSSLTSYEVNLTMSRGATNFQANANYQVVVQVAAGVYGSYNFGSSGFILGIPPTPTPSPTPTQTPSQTPSITGTPSPTKSPVDLVTGLLKEQAEKQKADAATLLNGVVGGVIGGIIVIGCLGFVIFKVIQRRQSAERRQRKLAATRRATAERESVYGVSIVSEDKPSGKEIANFAAYKAATKAQNNQKVKANSLTSAVVKSNSINSPAKAVGRGNGRSTFQPNRV